MQSSVLAAERRRLTRQCRTHSPEFTRGAAGLVVGRALSPELGADLGINALALCHEPAGWPQNGPFHSGQGSR